MKSTVIYISTCALDNNGKPGAFLLQELPWLNNHFDRVVICSRYGIAETQEKRPVVIKASKPIMAEVRALMRTLIWRPMYQELLRLHRDQKLSIINAIKLLMFTFRGFKLFYWILPYIRKNENTTVYSYWMSYDGFAAALCKAKKQNIRAIARAHAFDIDLARNAMNPYLMKRFMAERLDGIYPINYAAKKQLTKYLNLHQEKTKIVGAGSAGEYTETHLPAPHFQDGILRIISCSAMIPIKRLPLLIDTLSMWDRGKIHWTHIGNGTDEKTVQDYAELILGNNPLINYEFKGFVEPEEIRQMYATKAFDAFINVSENEGTPVTIMEALHAGIPVIAPRVGGIPELIDDQVGFLFQSNGNTQDVYHALIKLYELNPEKMEMMRVTAQKRWGECCSIAALMPEIFPNEAHEEAKA